MRFLLGGRRRLVLLFVFAVAAAVTLPAAAKVPGQNGRIVFSRATPDGQDSNTYTMNPDGSNVQPLFPFGSGAPHWSPDGTEVAVQTSLGAPCDPDCTISTAIINPDTGKYRLINPEGPPAVFTNCSIWSPDASHFACIGENDNDPSVNGVYTVRSSDGGGLTRITSNTGGLADIPIDYSPDGTQIVFGRVDPGDHHCTKRSAIYVVNTDGSGLHRITPWGFCDDDGSWSPDGKEIAFAAGPGLFVAHPDGTGLAQIPLATHSPAGAFDVSWSPDGKKITFGLFTPVGIPPSGPNSSFQQGIGTANADGTDVHLLTTTPTFDHEGDWGSHPLVR
jgi:Tol biopolymer transport system component